MVVAVRAASTSTTRPLGVVREAAVVRRSRPVLWIGGACLVVLSALSIAGLVGAAGDRVPVLAVARTVHIGQTISAVDLVVARIPADPELRPVPLDARDQVVGKTAAVELRAGTLLTLDAVTDTVAPGPGQQLVGVPVKSGRWPARGLVAGDRVLAVQVPDPASPPGPDATALSVAAGVWDVGAADADGTTTVDLIVDAAVGPELAGWAAAGRVALLSLPAGR